MAGCPGSNFQTFCIMKQIVLNNLPCRSAAVDCLALVRAAYGAAADLVTVGAGPYFYGFHAVYTVPAVDGWPALVHLMSASGRGDYLY